MASALVVRSCRACIRDPRELFVHGIHQDGPRNGPAPSVHPRAARLASLFLISSFPPLDNTSCIWDDVTVFSGLSWIVEDLFRRILGGPNML